MGRITRLDGLHLRYAFVAGTKCLEAQKDYINRINVFPVPDGDTGTNMVSTLRYIAGRAEFSRSFSRTFDSIAETALVGARGNSGLILAQYLYGLSRVFSESERVTVRSFGEGVTQAFPFALKALSEPEEGTIITVLRDWSHAVHDLSRECMDFRELLKFSLERARESLERTREILQPMKDAEVVDAGALGFVQFISGILQTGKDGLFDSGIPGKLPQIDRFLREDRHGYAGEERFCTEMVLEGREALPVEKIRSSLSNLGRSIVIGGGDRLLRVHIHTDDPSEVALLLKQWGDLPHQKVDDMFLQRSMPTRGMNGRKTALLTDSACDLPMSIMDRYHIHVIPMKLTLGKDEYLDKLTLKPGTVYGIMEGEDILPVSSMASPGEFRKIYSELLEHYDSVIAIHLSEKLSGTFQASLQAVSSLGVENRVTVINSRNLCVSLGLIVLQAAEALENGMDRSSVVQMIKNSLDRSFIYVSLPTLKYMVRGGRIPPLAGKIAGMLNLKPVISLDREGKGMHFGQACGKKRNIQKIQHLVLNHWKHNNLLRYAVVHAGALEEAELIAHELEEATGMKSEFIMEISPVIGLNSGPGSIAVGGVVERPFR
jgi:DegV family protein with EDD domain